METISKNAFANCEQLNTVSLGASLSNVTANPFSNCTALKEFVVDQASATFMADGHALIRKSDGTLVSFPCALTEYTASSVCKKLVIVVLRIVLTLLNLIFLLF